MTDTTVTKFPQKGEPANGGAKTRFTPGQIVWLKSGSPALTVSDLSKGIHPNVTVDWFDVDHCACRDAFHQDQLTTDPRAYPSSVVLPHMFESDLRKPSAVIEDGVTRDG